MKIYIEKDTNTSTKKFQERVNQHLSNVKFIEEEVDFSDLPWQEESDGDTRLPFSWYKKRIGDANEYHRNTIDAYFALIKQGNWEADDIYGLHLGQSYQDARICIVRNRNMYHGTMAHELLHALNDYIYIHTGIKLATVFDVDDFDEDVVHADKYEDYEFDEVFQKIKPYYDMAVGEDMADEYRNLAKTTIRIAKKLIRKLMYANK